MLVTLIGKNSMYKLTLPENVIGSYWIVDRTKQAEKKLVNIEAVDGQWQIKSNDYVKLLKPNSLSVQNKSTSSSQSVLDKITLKEYGTYTLCLGSYDNWYFLICSPVYERFVHLAMANGVQKFSIGRDPRNQIYCKNSLIGVKHAEIRLRDTKWILENFDKTFGTYVNNSQVKDKITVLSNGDYIYIMGLKIILMGNTIYVNNPLNSVECSGKHFDPVVVKNNPDLKKIEQNEFENGLDDDTIDENESLELYSEDEYFSRSPRLTNIIERATIKIDAPPQAESNEDTPLILTIGSSLTMGLIMLVTASRSIDGLINGTGTVKSTIFQLLTSFIMLIGMVVFPIMTRKYDKKRKKKHEEKRQERYKKYIDSKIAIINQEMAKQRQILSENFISVEECVEIILDPNKRTRLWERMIEDHDFLEVRFGMGNMPLNAEIIYPEEKFMMDDDNLLEILNTVSKKSKILEMVPITFPLAEKNISAVISKDQWTLEKALESIIVQLITFHNYDDLKLVFLLSNSDMEKWEYIKMLPHIWNKTRDVRFFANEYSEMEKISQYLEDVFRQRMSVGKDLDYKSFRPYYLIITDDYKKIEDLKIVQDILATKTNMGINILCLTDDLMKLPNECKSFVNIENSAGRIFESEITSTNQRQFKFDSLYRIAFDRICQVVANIPMRYTRESGKTTLPEVYPFLDMYKVGLIEQLNVHERWRKNDSTISLAAPIGVDSSGREILLDIHEKAHGPHGLIAGSTGSGKSEFIITYVLSLAVNYHPDDVAFILIDYKGGGLAGAFKKKDFVLPHIVGTITNLDTMELQRSLASIESELRRRQKIFNEARDMTEEGTIDIYKYQKLYHEGIVKKPVPHLLIICDEFAELKQQQPDFMDEIISVSRIGRSLGIHLILATQKPAGIVNDQIRSNSNFAICLKVQSREDSNDVIRRPDAANLRGQGQFYIQVGNDEYFNLGQSAWTGAPYFPSDTNKKRTDSSIKFISNVGSVIKQVDDSLQKKAASDGEQLTRTVQYLYNMAKTENVVTEQLWLDSIPETIYTQDIRKKYNIVNEANKLQAVIGEYDDPYNQSQGEVVLDLSSNGNTLVYGNAESGKETLLSTMIYDLITNNSPEDVNIYVLDYGTEALKIFSRAPHVGDVIFSNETEKVDRFFAMISQEIKTRRSILSDYNGSYDMFMQQNGDKSMPRIVVVLNNYEAFMEMNDDRYDDYLLNITREGINCGIVFVATVSTYSDMRYRLNKNFKQSIALQVNNEDDYYNIFDKIGKKRPSRIFGRGMVEINDEVYEFQTAKVCLPEDYNIFITEKIDELMEKYKIKARKVPILPEKVTFEDLEEDLNAIYSIPLGLSKKELKIYNYDFKKNPANLVIAKDIEDAIEYTEYLVEQMRKLRGVDVTIFDAEEYWTTSETNLELLYENFMKKCTDISRYNLGVIVGIDKFLNKLGEEKLTEALKLAEESDKCSFIIVESGPKIKNHNYDTWYKSFVLDDSGIWVGSGFEDQYIINITTSKREIDNNCGSTFGYAVRSGIPTLVKLLEMKEKGDNIG